MSSHQHRISMSSPASLASHPSSCGNIFQLASSYVTSKECGLVFPDKGNHLFVSIVSLKTSSPYTLSYCDITQSWCAKRGTLKLCTDQIIATKQFELGRNEHVMLMTSGWASLCLELSYLCSPLDLGIVNHKTCKVLYFILAPFSCTHADTVCSLKLFEVI